MNHKEWYCDFCNTEQHTLYEGWFRSIQSLNPFAKGTATAGLLQFHRVCKKCMNEAIDSKLACAENKI